MMITKSAPFTALLAAIGADNHTYQPQGLPNGDTTTDVEIATAVQDVVAMIEPTDPRKANDSAGSDSRVIRRAPHVHNWTPDLCLPSANSQWVIEDDVVYSQKETSKGLALTKVTGQLVQVVARSRDVDTGEEHVTLRWREQNHWRTKTIRRAIISSTGSIISLSDYGLAITNRTASLLIEYIAHLLDFNELNIPIFWIASRSGYKEIGGERVFFYGRDRVIGSGVTAPVIKLRSDVDDTDCLTPYREANEPNSLDHWVAMASRLSAYPICVFCLAAAFLPPLCRDLELRQNPIIDISGTTTWGKSTIAGLAASVWGFPPEPEGGITKRWASKPYFLEHLAALCNDLPIFLDESHRASAKLRTDFTYEFANGSGKGRGKGGRKLERPARYRGVLFSTGETPLKNAESFSGAEGRVLSFTQPPFGLGQEQLAEEISKVANKYYGCAGPLVLSRYLAEHETLLPQLQSWRDEAIARIKGSVRDGVGHRLSVLAAAVEAAGRLTCHFIPELGWDMTTSIDQSFEMIQGSRRTDPTSDTIELLRDWYSCNFDRFSETNQHGNGLELYGKWLALKDGEQALAILVSSFKWFLAEYGYSFEETLGAWVQRGWLLTDQDRRRNLKKVRFGNATTWMVVLSHAGMRAAGINSAGRDRTIGDVDE